MKNKFLSLLSAALVLVLALSLCNGMAPVAAEEEKTEIVFWHSMGGVNGEAIDYLVNKYNEENDKNIHVTTEFQGSYDDAINKLKSASIGNMAADLVQVYDIGTRFMIDSGWVIPMQDLIDRYDYDVTQIEPNIAAYYTVDDKLYSMPFNSSTPILYYNQDMLDKAGIKEAPKSFAEIAEMAEDLMDKGGAGEPISLSIYGWFFEQFLCKQGLPYVDNGNGREDKATKVVFDENEGALNILKAWKDLHDQGYAPVVGRVDAGLADFVAGKSAFTIGSTASLKEILENVDNRFQVGTAYLPSVTDETDGGVSIGGASLWALNNEDEAKEEAVWDFITFMISPASQAYWNAQTGYFPITVKAHDEDTFKENIEQFPQFMTAIDQLHDSSPESQGALISVFPEARQIIEGEIENMLNKDLDPEEVVKTMAEKINKAIEEYNMINE